MAASQRKLRSSLLIYEFEDLGKSTKLGSQQPWLAFSEVMTCRDNQHTVLARVKDQLNSGCDKQFQLAASLSLS